MKKKEICIVRLDTDNVLDVHEFKRMWKKLKVDVLFVPKTTKFIFKGNRSLK